MAKKQKPDHLEKLKHEVAQEIGLTGQKKKKEKI
ncbi:MAG TPA: small, acid-soluble spore protein, alpha/beta type [Syntrophomonadaceae bacterium]|jgi:hypothetical protein|nr:small, acid-soluble spore protein, alpha/beta type [Syntrophomonadaceae bacterium]HRX20446.1 small, acid-soluble spore protein, alpha/beta type [Syntrophomonadaceae bacterium]